MTARHSKPSSPARRLRGFTYVGLLAFVAVLGIMSVAAATTGAALQRRSQEIELLFIGSQFREAFRSYYENTPVGQRPYPDSLDDLVKDGRFPETRRHLRKVFADPLTGATEWGTIPAPGGGIAAVFSRAPGKPIKVAQFPPEFAEFEMKEKYSEWVFGYVPGQVASQSVSARK